jgi:hypothetical protein
VDAARHGRLGALTSPVQAAADAVAIVVFSTAGLLAHEGALSAAGYARTALPFLVGWFAIGAAAGLYREGGAGRLLATWALGVPAGLLLRAAALGEPPEAPFVVVAFVTVLVLVVALRGLLALADRLRRARTDTG